MVGRFWVFFLSYTAPGFQMGFYFHLCMYFVHWGLLLRLHFRTCFCPGEGQVWRWCSCLGHKGSGSTRYSGELVDREARNIVLKKGMATSVGQYTPLFLPTDPLTEAWQVQSSGSQSVGHNQSNSAYIHARLFF